MLSFKSELDVFIARLIYQLGNSQKKNWTQRKDQQENYKISQLVVFHLCAFQTAFWNCISTTRWFGDNAMHLAKLGQSDSRLSCLVFLQMRLFRNITLADDLPKSSVLSDYVVGGDFSQVAVSVVLVTGSETGIT